MKELNGLKNKMTKAAKKMTESEQRCKVDNDDFSECDCERLRAILLLLELRIRSVKGLLMTIIVLASKKRLRPTLRIFFGYVDLKKKRVGYPSVINFEGQSGIRIRITICDLLVSFMSIWKWKRTYANKPWVPSDPGPDDVSDEPPFGSLQFTVLEVLNALCLI
jgi:hypothetical protein